MMTAVQDNRDDAERPDRSRGTSDRWRSGKVPSGSTSCPHSSTTALTPTEIAQRFPAVATLDTDWVHILNDMTPMIGAMSDNVTNYQALASLPPFPLFPWFFVDPGSAGRRARGLVAGPGASDAPAVARQPAGTGIDQTRGRTTRPLDVSRPLTVSEGAPTTRSYHCPLPAGPCCRVAERASPPRAGRRLQRHARAGRHVQAEPRCMHSARPSPARTSA